MNGDGEVVNEEVTSTIWVQSIFDADEHGLGNSRKRKLARNVPSIKLPLSSLALGEVVQLLLNVIHNNGTAGVFTIGKFCCFCALDLSTRVRFASLILSLKLYQKTTDDEQFKIVKNKENLFSFSSVS